MPKHDKETLDLRAMKLIKKGEEITFCPQNPFQPKKKRQDFVCGSRCGCEICTRKPDEEGVPNENLYIGLERRFEKIAKFRARFFKELENVTFGDAEGWDEMQKKTKQINAVSEVERKGIVKTCRWIDEQRLNLGLMHPCFAEACEMVYIINMSYAAEHCQRQIIKRGDQSGVRSSVQSDDNPNANEGEADGNDDDERVPQGGDEGSHQAQESPKFPPTNTKQQVDDPAEPDHEQGSAKGDVPGDMGTEETEAPKQEDDQADAEPHDPVMQALEHAWVAKLAELEINVLCYGFWHENSWNVLLQAWSASLSWPEGKEGLKEKVLEYGYRLRQSDDLWFNIIPVGETEAENEDVQEDAEEGRGAGMEADEGDDGGIRQVAKGVGELGLEGEDTKTDV